MLPTILFVCPECEYDAWNWSSHFCGHGGKAGESESLVLVLLSYYTNVSSWLPSFFLLNGEKVSCYLVRYSLLDFSYLYPNAFLTDSPSKYLTPSNSVEYWSREKVMELKCLGWAPGSAILGKLFKSLEPSFTHYKMRYGSIRTVSIRTNNLTGLLWMLKEIIHIKLWA